MGQQISSTKRVNLWKDDKYFKAGVMENYLNMLGIKENILTYNPGGIGNRGEKDPTT